MQGDQTEYTETFKKTEHHMVLIQSQYRLVCKYYMEEQFLSSTTRLCLARNSQQTLRKSLLLFSIIWLDFTIWIIRSRAKQEVPTKLKCIQYAIWLYYRLHMWKMRGDQYVWKWKAVVSAHGSKSPPYTSLNYTTAKQQLSRVITVRCQPDSWTTSELTKDWLAVAWNGMPWLLLTN